MSLNHHKLYPEEAYSRLTFAVQSCDEKVLTRLIKEHGTDFLTSIIGTFYDPLWHAYSNQCHLAMKILLENGMDPNSYRYTIGHDEEILKEHILAASMRNLAKKWISPNGVKISMLLLEYGADPLAQSQTGIYGFSHAVRSKKAPLIQLFMKK